MKDKWLEQGYAQFAKSGPAKLSINQIGKEIGASRSSFYHHFGDIPFFIDELLAAHWEICQEFDKVAQKNYKNSSRTSTGSWLSTLLRSSSTSNCSDTEPAPASITFF